MDSASDIKGLELEQPRLVFEGNSYDLYSNQSGQFRNNTYVIVDKSTGKFALVDPLHDCLERWGSFFDEKAFPLDALWITHAHIDHVAGVAQLMNAFPNLRVFAHKDGESLMSADDVPRLTGGIETLEHYSKQFDVPMYEPVHPTDYLSEGTSINIGSTSFEILHTPGHCVGHVAFRNDNTLISGDVIYKGSVGFTTIPGSDPEVLARTILDTMLPLGDDTVIYPGHGPITTMGEERKTNPFIVEALNGRT
jgi:glyoxylase-like metal-dependent hydrolase (beta-lactamase superfamily II)